MTCQIDKVAKSMEGMPISQDTKYYARQIGSALVVILTTIVTGMTMGHSAVLLPQLKELSSRHFPTSDIVNDTINVTAPTHSEFVLKTIDEESWIAAAAALAMTPGCWLSSLLMHKLGRKKSVLVINPIALIGWLAIALANNFSLLITGRILCGLCAGLLGATSPVYIAETSHPRLRGFLLAALSLAVALGIFIVHALGTWLDWRLTACICAAFPIICFALGIFIPESPNWLLSRGKRDDALSAWIFLRGEQAIADFHDFTANELESTRNECNPSGMSSIRQYDWHAFCNSTWITTLTSSTFYVPLLIICIYAFTSQFSGINVVTFYCVQMLEEVSGPENAYVGTLVLDFFRIVFSVVACWLTRRYPRRILTMISGLGTCLTLFALSCCLYADFGRPWLPIVLLFVYTATIAIGLVPLPWLLCAELFDGSSRGFGSGLSAGFAFLCFFAVVKTGPLAFGVLTPAGTFTLYGTVALLGSAFLYTYLPETKDKPLRDIENVFASTTYLTERENKSSIVTIS